MVITREQNQSPSRRHSTTKTKKVSTDSSNISMTAPPATTLLSNSGKVFFGGLCAGTFGLGCWQVQRLMEKIHLMEERQVQLDMEPTANLEFSSSTSGGDAAAAAESYPYRRRLLQGTFRHDKEVLIGPRGAPPGVKLEVKGLSAKSGMKTQGSGMSAGPQGYHVLTPLELAPGTANRRMVWVNRGWVPKTLVPGADKPYARQGPVEKAKIQAALEEPAAWARPKGTVTITAVKSEVESESCFC
jgi:cytochrome oxidase assembly protein ShyY1